MKLALLTASLATAAVAAAAELKDPAAVALEWEKTAALVPASLVAPRLRDQVTTPPIFPERTWQEIPQWSPKAKKPGILPFGDGPLRPPEYDKDGRPRGAKPYRFNDETYWLIPLTT